MLVDADKIRAVQGAMTIRVRLRLAHQSRDNASLNVYLKIRDLLMYKMNDETNLARHHVKSAVGEDLC